MNFKRSILTTLVLAVMGMFLSGCGGECPFKKLFGPKECKVEKAPCPSTQPEKAPCPGTNP